MFYNATSPGIVIAVDKNRLQVFLDIITTGNTTIKYNMARMELRSNSGHVFFDFFSSLSES
jgi:hypothetical protein